MSRSFSLNYTARAAARIGDGWVLPSPTEPEKPIRRDLLRDWWQKLEAKVKLDRVRGRGWHSLRRMFATDLKHDTPNGGEYCQRTRTHVGPFQVPLTVYRTSNRVPLGGPGVRAAACSPRFTLSETKMPPIRIFDSAAAVLTCFAAFGLAACVTSAPPLLFHDGQTTRRWAYVAREPRGDSTLGELMIIKRARGLAGVVRTAEEKGDATNVRIEVDGPRIWFAAPTRSARASTNDRFFTVVAEPQADGDLVGRWYREDGRSGEWIARVQR